MHNSFVFCEYFLGVFRGVQGYYLLMRSMLCLFLLIIQGVALLVTNHTFFGLTPMGDIFFAKYWMFAVVTVAIPLSLFLLLFTKLDFVRTLALIWGLLLSVLSIGFLFQIEGAAPAVTLYGKLFVISVMIVSVALTIFESIELFELPIQIKQAKEAAEGKSETVAEATTDNAPQE